MRRVDVGSALLMGGILAALIGMSWSIVQRVTWTQPDPPPRAWTQTPEPPLYSRSSRSALPNGSAAWLHAYPGTPFPSFVAWFDRHDECLRAIQEFNRSNTDHEAHMTCNATHTLRRI